MVDLELITAKPSGEENGFVRESATLDLDIVDTDDFELTMSSGQWSKEKHWYGTRLFVPGTEYGGIIDDIRSETGTDEIILCGSTWRGMLKKKVVQPPANQTNLILSGDLNQAIAILLGDRFDGLFLVPEVVTGITIKNWSVDRYVTLHDALQKLVDAYGCRLQIKYVEPEGPEYGYVTIEAVRITDYSKELEYSQDSNTKLSVRDYRGGINHLICIGKGEGTERTVIHLYVQQDGTVGSKQYYTGLDEKEAVYEFSSAEYEELEKDGREKIADIRNYKSVEMTIDDADLEIGDIVAGYDAVTDTYVSRPIVGKILKIEDGKTEIEYEIKGDD